MMLVGMLAGLSLIEISAASTKDDEVSTEDLLKKYFTTVYETPEQKLATMTSKLEKDGYRLYVDELSGEIAVLDTASGQIQFSNPYDIATTHGSESTKVSLMSQLVVTYDDNGIEKVFNSFDQAAYRDQIKVKNIKNGIRVEYTLGRENVRMLVPRLIFKERFEEKILAPIAEAIGKEAHPYKKIKAIYLLKDLEAQSTERGRNELLAAFPIVAKGAVYVIANDTTEKERRTLEEIIKTYAPEYTYEELDRDHELTGYDKEDRAPALFKMALEYTLDNRGLSVRLPANGIRFDESEYKLTNINMLPFMGAGANYSGSGKDDPNALQTGYTFFPDGSGSLFKFEELSKLGSTNISGKVYGLDYAYHTLTGAQQETIRYPAFGVVSNEKIKQTVTITDADGITTSVQQLVGVDRGYLAIIEEGDALAEIYTVHQNPTHKYNAIQVKFYPRPTDKYNMRDAITIGENKDVTVVSKRKYVGSYKIRYIMLTDENIAESKRLEKYYRTTWVGMGLAYRDYLTDTGVFKRLNEADVKEDIPLYIETFGAIETVKKILSIPVNTMAPLTSFDDVMTMYNELSNDGITNINFKLTGYANGGMHSTVPYKLKWEKAVGGGEGFEKLVEYAVNEGFGIYPEFDFVYVNGGYSTTFDGLSMKKHISKTIDNRYVNRQEYSATYQTFVSYWDLAIASACYSHFYEKLTTNYLKYNYPSISISSLGSDLNSDFDEKEPYNREDSKGFTIEALKYFDENYDNIMVSGGNSYVWRYVDHILNVSLDSSRHIKSSNSVPFLGFVLHGSVQFSGSPLNMEGNIGYAMLRTIENGAAPFFTLSYQNSALLKDDWYYNKYYSVRYDIWYDELVEIYKELNSALRDVQTKVIINHEFLIGERIPDEDEIEADILQAMKDLKLALNILEQYDESNAIRDILTARQTAKGNAVKIAAELEKVIAASATAQNSIAKIEAALIAQTELSQILADAQSAEAAALQAKTDADDAKAAANTALNEAKATGDAALIAQAQSAYDAANAAALDAGKAYTDAQSAAKTANTNKTNKDKELAAALKEGTDAADIADKSAATAASLTSAASEAAEFVSKVDSATEAIKQTALDYAAEAEAGAALIYAHAKETNTFAAVAKAISAEAAVTSVLKTAADAKKGIDDSIKTVDDRYQLLLDNKTRMEDAIAAEAQALKAYEEAREAYRVAGDAAVLPTATEADKAAATAAGNAMNAANVVYTEARAAATRAKNSYNQSISSLRQILKRIYDYKNVVVGAGETADTILAGARDAMDALLTMEGISDLLKSAAASSYAAAMEKLPEINDPVEQAKAIYDEQAERVKEYVVILEEPAVPVEPETPAAPTDEETDGENGEEPGEQTPDTGYAYTKYTNQNGNIVKVTYGERDSLGGNIPYKTFILNYNFFDVTVVIDGIKYTIPQAGYVVLYH